MTAPAKPKMVAVHCPACARRGEPHEIFIVRERLAYQVVRIEDGGPATDFSVKCAGCGKRWAVKVFWPAGQAG